ncbi:MAG: long-chain fatty acid--CoA ligase, partial [Candidatus Pelagibacterales bacterium]
MKFDQYKNLIELFFHRAEMQDQKDIFLEWLNVVNRKKFTWAETISSIHKLTKNLKTNLKEGDRVLLVSENRPEWLIADISIMLANGITVPAYITYTENDYQY